MFGSLANLSTAVALGLDNQANIFAKRPYINSRGALVIDVPSGIDHKTGQRLYRQREIATPGNFNVNATLRKDEWVSVDMELHEAFRERLVIIDDLRAKGLIHSVGGLGVMISEWENGSEITDAEISMNPEAAGEKDRQKFGIQGVPIPVIHKEFDIGERVLIASRTRGASLDVTTGVEAARSVARTSEKMVFNGITFGASNSAGTTYQIYGLTTFPSRARKLDLSDWSSEATTAETILGEILEMIQQLETDERRFGPFSIYIPADASFQFYKDFKANSDKTLMQRVLEDPRIESVKVSDVLASENVVVVSLDKMTLDLAVGSEESNIQWASGSGWTNHFQNFAAWAPRLKTDFDARCGILHADESGS